MNAQQSKKGALVQRITVDEKLADDLIRLLISPLAERVERDFGDAENDWEEEYEGLIRPGDYAQKMSIPKSREKMWPWTDLEEGQVFISGQFKVVGHAGEPEKFEVSPGQHEFLSIDKLAKKEIKRLYFDALKGKRRK